MFIFALVLIRDNFSSFGRSFIEAAERSGARIKHDGFEESIIEVQREDLNNFLHVLTLLAF